jgi:hypothetical protein
MGLLFKEGYFQYINYFRTALSKYIKRSTNPFENDIASERILHRSESVGRIEHGASSFLVQPPGPATVRKFLAVAYRIICGTGACSK